MPQQPSVPLLLIAGHRIPGRLHESKLIISAQLAVDLLGLGIEVTNPLIISGREIYGRDIRGALYIPARDLCEALGYTARWDPQRLELLTLPKEED